MRQPACSRQLLLSAACVCRTTCFTPQQLTSPPPTHSLATSLCCCSLFPVRPFSMSVIDTLAECVHKGKRQLCSLWAPTQRRIGRSTHPPARLPLLPLILFATLRNAVGHVQINGYFSTLCNLQTLSFSSLLLSPSLAYNSYSCGRGSKVEVGKVEN